MEDDSYQERTVNPIYPNTAQERRLLGNRPRLGAIRRIMQRNLPENKLPFDHYIKDIIQSED